MLHSVNIFKANKGIDSPSANTRYICSMAVSIDAMFGAGGQQLVLWMYISRHVEAGEL